MKLIYHCNYKFYRSDLKPQKFLAISDIHFVDKINKNHQRVLSFIKNEKPDYILISGDSINHIHVAESPSAVKLLREFFTKLGKIAPVCLCLGNHDSFRKIKPFRPKGYWHKIGYVSEKSSPLKNLIGDISNIHLLENDSYEDDSVFVFGFSLPADYYENVDHPGLEKKEVLIEELDRLSKKISNLPVNKPKILLAHSPFYFADPDVKERLSEFDFILTGHTHNGVVPPVLHEIWRGRRGILLPYKRILSRQIARIGFYKNQLIVLGAVTTIVTSGLLNSAFPTNVATIEIVNEKMKKPKIKRHYKKAA